MPSFPLAIRRLAAQACGLALALLIAWPTPAAAFCGFYVSGADGSLYNEATMVVMMREGTKTVLSMQNSYKGPPENFAMVIPVPVVLQKENVKTLPPEIFDRIDKLAAPRLVEYWEQDPCQVMRPHEEMMMAPMAAGAPQRMRKSARADDLGVTIEAQFKVKEYEVVILSAKDSTGLDTWLRREGYSIPAGAEPVLRPYVEEGTKFFVAKVDVSKVKFDAQGRVMLSPLRFHYNSEAFRLPIRLGLLNSSGTQDLLVHVLAPGQRYEVANYRNVAIPTNIEVDNSVRSNFGSFYAALFDRTIEETPGAVVTEYSWDASSCDPCPSPALNQNELMTLGGDVLAGGDGGAVDPGNGILPRRRPQWRPRGGFVLTRLHYRYTKAGLGEDLIFRAAPPVVGGRGTPDAEGVLQEKGAKPGGMNNFQGRYAILHRWEGNIACDNPRRGLWGGPPGRGEPRPMAAQNLAFAARGKLQLAAMVKQPMAELTATPGWSPPNAPKLTPPPSEGAKSGDNKPADDPGAATGNAHQDLAPAQPVDPQSNGGCAGCALAGRTKLPWLTICSFLGLALGLGRRRQRS